MSALQQPAQLKARLVLLGLLAVFALPLIAAWFIALGPLDWRPARTTNNGVLLSPPLPLSSHGIMDASGSPLTLNAVANNWFLVVLHATACAESCQDLLQIANRLSVAVGRDSERVMVAALGPENYALTADQRNWLLPADGKFLSALQDAANAPQLDTALLVVDHQGIVVLLYPPTETGTGALQDVKRLLRSSSR